MKLAIAKQPLPFSLLASGSLHVGLLALLALSWASRPLPRTSLEITLIKPEPGATATLVRRTSKKPRGTASEIPARAKKVAADQALLEPTAVATEPALSAEPASSGDSAEWTSQTSSYEAEIQSLLNARKVYPEAARRLRQQGRVRVQFEINKEGQILAVAIVERCRHPLLNEAAERLVREVRHFKPFPATAGQLLSWKFTVPIEYRM